MPTDLVRALINLDAIFDTAPFGEQRIEKWVTAENEEIIKDCYRVLMGIEDGYSCSLLKIWNKSRPQGKMYS